MQRRDFVRASVLGLCNAAVPGIAGRLMAQAPAPDPEVRRVLVMFKCHFDAGFIDTQHAVVQRYFTSFYPEAIRIAELSRRAGANRYVWTTGSWLLYEYLEQASPAERSRMERAIQEGDIAWHAIPFNWQTELMDESTIAASIALSHSLDRRFGRKTTGSKMTDVPGHTRGIVSPLASQGVTFLDIGVNSASTPAMVPPLFVWKDTRGATLVVMYHLGYGAVTRVPRSDLAVAIVCRNDNSGPHPPAEIAAIYDDLRRQYPNAGIEATSLTEIANAVEPFRSHLPVVTGEIGDTWIYGAGSDPLKVARYREVLRLRRSWIDGGRMAAGDATDVALLRKLLLEAEHTWGTDTKTWLDYDHYTPRALSEMLDTRNYKVVTYSWQEKRQDLLDGIATLPAAMREEAHAAIEALAWQEPRLSQPSTNPSAIEIQSEHFILAVDPHSGAIHRLQNRHSGREWASPQNPLALVTYQTLSPEDYAQYQKNYVVSTADWAKKDFGKPNMGHFGARHQEWHPLVTQSEISEDERGHQLLAKLEISDSDAVDSGRAAFPRRMYLEIALPRNEPAVHLAFSWFAKDATRMSEALWATFNPLVTDPRGWSLDKCGEPVSPFEVIEGGGRRMHAVSSGVKWQDANGSFGLEMVDAPVIAMGERSALNFSRDQPDLSGGIHCSPFNNAWGTNYIMWFGENMRFRFTLRAS